MQDSIFVKDGNIPSDSSLAEIISESLISHYNTLIFPDDILIKKYGKVSEEVLDASFRLVEEKSRNSKKPVLYLNYDEFLCDMLISDESNQYYQLVGRLLASANLANISNSNIDKLTHLYEHNFEKIHSTNRGLRAESILSANNLGMNLVYLLNSLKDESKFEFPFRFIVNMSFLPNYSKGEVMVSNNINQPSDLDKDYFSMKVRLPTFLMQHLYEGGSTLQKAIVLPGFTIDLLDNPNHSWNQGNFATDILRETANSFLYKSNL